MSRFNSTEAAAELQELARAGTRSRLIFNLEALRFEIDIIRGSWYDSEEHNLPKYFLDISKPDKPQDITGKNLLVMLKYKLETELQFYPMLITAARKDSKKRLPELKKVMALLQTARKELISL